MTRVLVTGATGFVGQALCPALIARGHRVAAATRGGAIPGDDTRAIDDIGPDTDWAAALEGIEVVVHLAALAHVTARDGGDAFDTVNAEGTLRLAEESARSGVRRLVFVSTVKVNGETTPGAPFAATDPPRPEDAYGTSKWRAEQALAAVARDSGLETVVIRPPLVYGPHVKGNFLTLLHICRRGWPLPLGGVANRRSLIYVGNLVDAIGVCLDHPDAAGSTYLVRDGEDLAVPDLIRRLTGALGRPARLFPLPDICLRMAARLAGRGALATRLLDTLRVDDARIRDGLGWRPPFTVDQGLRDTADWYEGNSHR